MPDLRPIELGVMNTEDASIMMVWFLSYYVYWMYPIYGYLINSQ